MSSSPFSFIWNLIILTEIQVFHVWAKWLWITKRHWESLMKSLCLMESSFQWLSVHSGCCIPGETSELTSGGKMCDISDLAMFVYHESVLLKALNQGFEIFWCLIDILSYRAAQMLSLVSTPSQLLNPAQTDVMPCEYLSLDTMERWIILGYMLIPQTLQKQAALECWAQALQTGWVITLFR